MRFKTRGDIGKTIIRVAPIRTKMLLGIPGSVIWLILISTKLVIIEPLRVRDFHHAVTPLVDAEQYYLHVKHSDISNSRYDYLEEEELEEKMDICDTIIESPLFRWVYKVEVSPREEIIHIYLNGSGDKSNDAREHAYKSQNFPHYGLHFKNRYRLLNITVGEITVQEFVFSCLATKSAATHSEGSVPPDRENMLEYFISPEYNVNERRDNKYARTGRFIFKRRDKNENEVIALAEEPAAHWVSDSHRLKRKFRRTIKNRISSYHDVNATVCAFTLFQKMRLCSVILNAATYRKFLMYDDTESSWKFEFIPDKKSVFPECELKDTQFTEPADSRLCESCGISIEEYKRLHNDKPVAEHVIGCLVTRNTAVNAMGTRQLQFYISIDVSQRNSFYVFREQQNVTYLESNYMVNM